VEDRDLLIVVALVAVGAFFYMRTRPVTVHAAATPQPQPAPYVPPVGQAPSNPQGAPDTMTQVGQGLGIAGGLLGSIGGIVGQFGGGSDGDGY
jgi:hypothetical protein